MERREDDITAPPLPTSSLSQDTPPHPWTPPAQFGQEGASRSGVTVEVAPPGSGPGSTPANRQGPPWMDKRDGKQHGHEHGTPILGPVLLIAAGSVFLLNNLGYLPWAIWGQLWRLWPLVLVAIGLDMLLGRRNPVASLVIVLGVLGAGAGVLYYTGGFAPARILSLPLDVPLSETKTAESHTVDVNIKLDGSNLSLVSVDGESRQLLSGSLDYFEREGEPIHEVTSSYPHTTIRLERGTADNFSIFGFADNSLSWDVRLTRQIPLALSMDVGDGNSTLDLSNLRVRRLGLRGDDGNIRLTAPENAGTLTGDIEIDDGNVDIIVPKSVAARIHVEKDDGNIRNDSEFRQDGENTYISSGSGSSNKLELNINMQDGNVNLRSK